MPSQLCVVPVGRLGALRLSHAEKLCVRAQLSVIFPGWTLTTLSIMCLSNGLSDRIPVGLAVEEQLWVQGCLGLSDLPLHL